MEATLLVRTRRGVDDNANGGEQVEAADETGTTPGNESQVLSSNDRWEAALQLKDKQIRLVSTQNEELRNSISRIETELQAFSDALMKKDTEARKLKNEIQKRDDEIRELKALEHQAQGRERAMEIASSQNSQLLSLLEAQETKAKEVEEERDALRDEVRDIKELHNKEVKKSADTEAKLIVTIQSLTRKLDDAEEKYSDLARRHTGFEDRVREAERRAEVQVQSAQEELTSRRDKQYELLNRLTAAEEAAQKARDQEEAWRADRALLVERADELQSRLDDTLSRLHHVNSSLNDVRNSTKTEIEAVAHELKVTAQAKGALECEVAKLSETMIKVVDKQKDTLSLLQARDSQAAAYVDEIRSLRDDRDKKADTIKELADTRREQAASVTQLDRDKQRLSRRLEKEEGRVGELEQQLRLKEIERVPAHSSGRRTLLSRSLAFVGDFNDFWSTNLPTGPETTPLALPPSLTGLNLDECAITDGDAKLIARTCMRCPTLVELSLKSNLLTDQAMEQFAPLIVLDESRLRSINFQANGFSTEAMQQAAELLERSKPRGTMHIYIQRNGVVQALGGSTLSDDPTILTIDFSKNFRRTLQAHPDCTLASTIDHASNPAVSWKLKQVEELKKFRTAKESSDVERIRAIRESALSEVYGRKKTKEKQRVSASSSGAQLPSLNARGGH